MTRFVILKPGRLDSSGRPEGAPLDRGEISRWLTAVYLELAVPAPGRPATAIEPNPAPFRHRTGSGRFAGSNKRRRS